MDLFLAKVIGVYLVILSLFLLVRKDLVKSSSDELFNSSALMAITGSLNLIFGLLIVFSFNVWEVSFRLLITLIGWLGVVSGVIRLLVPEWSRKLVRSLGDNSIIVIGVVFLIIGLYLAYVGFAF